jgi:outer membrane protein assembly factor BamD
LYRDAKDDIAAGNYEQAAKTLTRLEGLAAGTLLAQQAQLELAYLHWKQAEKAEALATIERFIRVNPSSPALDYALYLRGIINFNDNLGILGSLTGQNLSERDQRAARDAYDAFKELVERFPDSRYANDARQRMDYIFDSLAAYEVHVARYYYRRGAYVAAAARASRAVTDFQRSQAAEEALYIMVLSYDKLGLPTLRDDADRVLKQNFPDSPFIARGFAAPDKRWWQLW